MNCCVSTHKLTLFRKFVSQEQLIEKFSSSIIVSLQTDDKIELELKMPSTTNFRDEGKNHLKNNST